MGVLDLVVPVLIVAVAERALARRPQSPAENLAAAEASRHLPVQGVRDMDQQDTLRVISALRNEARRLERIAKAANPDPPAYREGLREEVRAMDRLAGDIRNSGVYTRNEVSTAANNGADLVGYGDELNMVVNAQMTRLDKPDATLDDVILANWQCEAEDFEEAGITGWATRELTEDEHQRAEAALIDRMKEYLS